MSAHFAMKKDAVVDHTSRVASIVREIGAEKPTVGSGDISTDLAKKL